MAAMDWRAVEQQKIRKCIEEQFETEEKMEALAKERIREGLEKIQQVKAKEAEDKEKETGD